MAEDQTAAASSSQTQTPPPAADKGKGFAVVEDKDDMAVAAQQLVLLSDEKTNSNKTKDSSTTHHGDHDEVLSKLEERTSDYSAGSNEVTSSSLKISIEAIFGREDEDEAARRDQNKARKRKYRALSDIYRVSKRIYNNVRYEDV